MLNALYDYAIRHDLSLPDGYAKKTVAAYISFSSNVDDYVEIHMGECREVPCPDIGSLANSKEKSNIIVEKRSVVIPDEENVKSTFFLKALIELGQVDPDAALCAEKLSNADILERIRELLDENKIKPPNRISFMVDGRKLHNSPYLLEWWKNWRQRIMPPKKGDLAPCLITGELTTPVATAPSIKGLRVVGGHASGDALICFDKPAFCSYGLKQAANAPVSEPAMGAVKAALDELISDAPILCGMKFVHWYDRDVEKENDPFFDVNFFGLGNADQEDDELDDTYYNPNHPESAYHCGAAMAVYGEIQHKAMPEVNVNIAQRFYASCIQTPALVLGRLSHMSVHHLAKIENKFYQNLYRELLEQVHTAIGPAIPTTLNLEKQSYLRSAIIRCMQRCVRIVWMLLTKTRRKHKWLSRTATNSCTMSPAPTAIPTATRIWAILPVSTLRPCRAI